MNELTILVTFQDEQDQWNTEGMEAELEDDQSGARSWFKKGKKKGKKDKKNYYNTVNYYYQNDGYGM